MQNEWNHWHVKQSWCKFFLRSKSAVIILFSKARARKQGFPVWNDSSTYYICISENNFALWRPTKHREIEEEETTTNGGQKISLSLIYFYSILLLWGELQHKWCWWCHLAYCLASKKHYSFGLSSWIEINVYLFPFWFSNGKCWNDKPKGQNYVVKVED